MTIDIKKCESADAIRDLQQLYQESLTGCIDAIVDEIATRFATYFTIHLDSERIGYFCTDKNNCAWQFYITDDHLKSSSDIFSHLISSELVKKAAPMTVDPLFMSVCLDFQKNVTSHSLMFFDFDKIEPTLDGFDNLEFRPGTVDDLDDVKRNIDGFGNWEYYAKRNEVFLLYDANILLGVGLYEDLRLYPPYKNLGMNVNENYRQKGIGAYIIALLKQKCYMENKIPFAGCGQTNTASRKTLEKAGFRSKNRFVIMEF